MTEELMDESHSGHESIRHNKLDQLQQVKIGVSEGGNFDATQNLAD